MKEVVLLLLPPKEVKNLSLGIDASNFMPRVVIKTEVILKKYLKVS